MRVKNPSKALVDAAEKHRATYNTDMFVHGARVYRIVPCTGAAHENPHQDGCALCAPLWGYLLSDEGSIASGVRMRESKLIK